MRTKAESIKGKQDLVQLTFSLKGKNEKVNWKEKGKEFGYNGEMYDVVKISSHKGSVTYFCLQDEEEKTLMSNFDRLVNNNLGNSGKGKKYTVKELSKYNFNHITGAYLPVNEVQFTLLVPDFYRSISIGIHSPPPKTI